MAESDIVVSSPKKHTTATTHIMITSLWSPCDNHRALICLPYVIERRVLSVLLSLWIQGQLWHGIEVGSGILNQRIK